MTTLRIGISEGKRGFTPPWRLQSPWRLRSLSDRRTQSVRANDRAGFTLLELLFVIITFVVLTALSMPLFSRTVQGWTRTNAAQDILSLMAFARERAIVEQKDYGIHFDLAAKTYWLVRRREDLTGSEFDRVPEKWGQAHTFPATVEVRVETPSVLFHPDGTATAFSLEWQAPHEPPLRLSVDPIQGLGKIDERS